MHDVLIKKAIDAIHEVHGDTTVSLEKTLSSLGLLGSEVDICMDAVRDDIKRAGKGA